MHNFRKYMKQRIKSGVKMCDTTHKPHWALVKGIRWPREEKKGSLLYGGPQLSRQKQNTPRQNQILHSKSKIALVLPWVFAFAVKYLVFAVKYLVLPWGLCFCRKVFGYAVRYFVFAVGFLVLPWGILFLPWGFWFCRDSSGPPYLLPSWDVNPRFPD